LDIDAYPLGRFCMPLHGAATTHQGPDTAVHDVSNTAYRLVATRSYRGYDHLAATLRSWAGSMLSHNGPLSAVVLAGLHLRRTKGSWQQSSFTTTSHSLCIALIPSRAPLLYNTASPFTMGLRQVTMPFKLRSKREGWACCLSRRARQCLGVVGRESRSSFTWNHVNSTLHTRSTTSSGSPRNTPALSSRRTLHHCLSVTTIERHTLYNSYLTHHDHTTSCRHHVRTRQPRLRARPACGRIQTQPVLDG
jgi:hypothetical protein